MNESKTTLSVFLCDMVHNHLGAGSYMFPLNIGYLAAYMHKQLGDGVQTRLFKYPDALLKALETEVPDVIGFSNYTWNADLNNRLADHVRSLSPQALVVFGGPNINYSDKGVAEFFTSHPAVDFYVPYQGEIPLANLLARFVEVGRDRTQLAGQVIEGAYAYDTETSTVLRGQIPDRIKNPDDIPSPYLTGLLDEFFEFPLIPIVETNRGCPYQCIFCAQGLSSHHQINYFSIERVRAELQYIASHVKHTNILNLADSNFGIVERDLDIARDIAELTRTTGYPRRCNTNWAKNQPKIFKIAEVLDNVNLAVSLQSLDTEVLANVKRRNISIDFFRDIVERVNTLGGQSGTEIILGLPGETRQSHIETLRQLFDWDVSCIVCYNGLVLDGTEMAELKDEGKFRCRTRYRLIDSSFGKYGPITSFEAEQGIMATETMSEDELLGFRPVHWLIQFLWNYRFYYDLLKYLQVHGVNPLDFILRLIEDVETIAPRAVQSIFDDFKRQARAEWFDSVEDLRAHYVQGDNFRKLEQGQHGKMNGMYVFRVLLEAKEAFERYMFDTACRCMPTSAIHRDILRQIVEQLSASIIDFNHPWDKISHERILTGRFDLTAWRASNHSHAVAGFVRPRPCKWRVTLGDDQCQALEQLLHQYDHANKNVTLRKMSEFISVRELFYRFEPCESPVREIKNDRNVELSHYRSTGIPEKATS